MFTFLSNLGSPKTFPAPKATAESGSIASVMGKPVASFSKASKPFISDPPPATTNPLSTISAANSGGAVSYTHLTLPTNREV